MTSEQSAVGVIAATRRFSDNEIYYVNAIVLGAA
jgi:hypothetical protein